MPADVGELVVALPQGLGTIHRRIGVVEHVFGPRIARRAASDTDARRRGDDFAFQSQGLGQLGFEPSGYFFRLGAILDFGEEDGELVASKPSRDIAGAEFLPQLSSDLD